MNLYRVEDVVSKRKKDRDIYHVYRIAKHSGNFPLTFNFVHLRDGRHIQCSFCGRFIYYRDITRDHVYPKSKGGTIKAPACEKCNTRKKDMKPIEWAIYAAKHREDMAVLPIGEEYSRLDIEELPHKRVLLGQFASLLDAYINAAVV